MKPCKIADDKKIHTTSKELMAIEVMRQRNLDEKSGEGACGEGLDRGIKSLLLTFLGT